MSNVADSNANVVTQTDTGVDAFEALTVREDVAVKQPVADKKDFFVQTRASTLNKCREKLNKIKNHSFTYGEILLSICSVGIGVIASAYFSNVQLNKDALFPYVITPVVSSVCGVWYFIKRKDSHKAASDLAEEILDELPNPAETVDVKVKQ
ncbi:hypothetical protein PTW35_08715 [Photobacterium sp. DA100]|uniref:hypothetical protein n=1 Tax=Photobacterium sp. DA100 TaxID=3027472 RepID=UPI00247A17BE|nr:hypothetical protein [Photobacterium sp. DA100]WEM43840.1 hypothetical protein PTW35_08715 [Photobacterium sp. DA100]